MTAGRLAPAAPQPHHLERRVSLFLVLVLLIGGCAATECGPQASYSMNHEQACAPRKQQVITAPYLRGLTRPYPKRNSDW